MPTFLIFPNRDYRVRLELERDPTGIATLTRIFKARSKAQALELARLELNLTVYEAAQRLTVEEI